MNRYEFHEQVYDGYYDCIIDNKTHNKYFPEQIIEVLNQQDEKIKELEDSLKLLGDYTQITNNLDYEYREEIKKLKQELANELDDHEKFVLTANDELQKLKAQNIELCTKLNMKEHEPAFCKLADRDCEYLGKVEELKKQLEKTIKDTTSEIAYYTGISENQLAIEELKEVYVKYYETGEDVLDYISQRIKELRGEK